jgi:DNA-directed RNA polymerase subunit beta
MLLKMVLALGRNLKVALCHGRINFEDAIVGEKFRDDIFTSIHVDDYSLEVLN